MSNENAKINEKSRRVQLTNNEDIVGTVEGGINSLILVENMDGVSKRRSPGEGRSRGGEGGGAGGKSGNNSELHG